MTKMLLFYFVWVLHPLYAYFTRFFQKIQLFLKCHILFQDLTFYFGYRIIK